MKKIYLFVVILFATLGLNSCGDSGVNKVDYNLNIKGIIIDKNDNIHYINNSVDNIYNINEDKFINNTANILASYLYEKESYKEKATKEFKEKELKLSKEFDKEKEEFDNKNLKGDEYKKEFRKLKDTWAKKLDYIENEQNDINIYLENIKLNDSSWKIYSLVINGSTVSIGNDSKNFYDLNNNKIELKSKNFEEQLKRILMNDKYKNDINEIENYLEN